MDSTFWLIAQICFISFLSFVSQDFWCTTLFLLFNIFIISRGAIPSCCFKKKWTQNLFLQAQQFSRPYATRWDNKPNIQLPTGICTSSVNEIKNHQNTKWNIGTEHKQCSTTMGLAPKSFTPRPTCLKQEFQDCSATRFIIVTKQQAKLLNQHTPTGGSRCLWLFYFRVYW